MPPATARQRARPPRRTRTTGGCRRHGQRHVAGHGLAIDLRRHGGAGHGDQRGAVEQQFRAQQRAFQHRRVLGIAHQQVGRRQRVLVQRARRRNAQVIVALAALVLHRGGQSGLEDFDVGSVSHVASPAGGRCTIAAPAGIARARRKPDGCAARSCRPGPGPRPGRILAVDGLELDDVAGPEEHHRIAQMRQALARLEDRRGRHAEHLITAGAAHGIDAAEATAMSHRVPGRAVRGRRPRHLQLALALDHLEHEGQAGHETHHGHEPGRAGMRVDEGLHRRKAVDARGVFQIGGCRVLVPLAKAHQRLVRPRVVVVDRDFDDARVQAEIGHVDAVLQLSQQGQQRVGRDAIGS